MTYIGIFTNVHSIKSKILYIVTANPSKLLSLKGTLNTITLDPSAAPNPVMNTTLSTQNLTISSAAGSVIIRLG